MSYGPTRVFTTTIASGTSMASALDLGTKSYRNFAVYHSGVSGAINVYASHDGSTYKPLTERVNTASVQWAALVLPSSVSGNWATNPCPPTPYLQFGATGTCANGATIYVAFDD